MAEFKINTLSSTRYEEISASLSNDSLNIVRADNEDTKTTIPTIGFVRDIVTGHEAIQNVATQFGGYSSYTSADSYISGDIVVYNGKMYAALSSNQDIDPTDTERWEPTTINDIINKSISEKLGDVNSILEGMI